MTEKQQMYFVGECRICGTGPLGLRACGNCQTVVILCDECDALWKDADLSVTPQYADEGDLPCPGCSSSLFDSPAHWATKKEIEAVEWLSQALRHGKLKLKLGSAFAPDANHEE